MADCAMTTGTGSDLKFAPSRLLGWLEAWFGKLGFARLQPCGQKTNAPSRQPISGMLRQQCRARKRV